MIWNEPTPPHLVVWGRFSGQLFSYSLSHVLLALNCPLSRGTILYCQSVGPNPPSWLMLPNMAAVWIGSKVCRRADQYFSFGVLPQIDEKLLLLDGHGV